MNSEFERNQITRKGVFVKSKRLAPLPPKSESNKPGFERLEREKISNENQINLGKMNSNVRTESRLRQEVSTSHTKDKNEWTKCNRVGDFDWNNKTQPNIETKDIEDDSSIAMLNQLEMQINRLEFDTKIAPKEPFQAPNTPVFKKPVQYTGLESLLNTGVSNVATEHGLGYFEKDPNENLRNLDEEFKRNTSGRQSLGGQNNWTPPVTKTSRQVARTASDSEKMKELVITKRTLKQQDVQAGPKIAPREATNQRQSSFRDKRQAESGGKPNIGSENKSGPMPTDVRKFVEAHMALKVMRLIKLRDRELFQNFLHYSKKKKIKPNSSRTCD